MAEREKDDTMQLPTWPLLREFLETKFRCLEQVFDVKVQALHNSQEAGYQALHSSQSKDNLAIQEELKRLADYQRTANGHVRDLLAWQKIVDPIVTRLDEVAALVAEAPKAGKNGVMGPPGSTGPPGPAAAPVKENAADDAVKIDKIAWGVSKRNVLYLLIGIGAGAGGLAGVLELVRAILPAILSGSPAP